MQGGTHSEEEKPRSRGRTRTRAEEGVTGSAPQAPRGRVGPGPVHSGLGLFSDPSSLFQENKERIQTTD